jgi:hypothetical protein
VVVVGRRVVDVVVVVEDVVGGSVGAPAVVVADVDADTGGPDVEESPSPGTVGDCDPDDDGSCVTDEPSGPVGVDPSGAEGDDPAGTVVVSSGASGAEVGASESESSPLVHPATTTTTAAIAASPTRPAP